MSAAAERGDLEQVGLELTALQGAIQLHARHEEEVFFPLLDRLFDDAVLNANLRDAHEREDKYEAALIAALEAEDIDAVRDAITAWAPSFEKHLVDEEEVMMPLTQRVHETVEGRAAAVADIVALDWSTFQEKQLPYVLRSLSDTKPYGPLRMYVAAVEISTGERFSELQSIIATNVAPEKADLLRQHGHLT